MLWYLASWLVNFLLIAVIVAIIDENMKGKIEEHQGLGAFLIFVIPTVLEIAAYHYANAPFITLIFG